MHDHARIVAQLPGELAVADIDGMHQRRAVREQHIGEPAGRRADIEADAPLRRRARNARAHARASARRARPRGGPARAVQSGVLGQQVARLGDPPLAAEHVPGHDERLRPRRGSRPDRARPAADRRGAAPSCVLFKRARPSRLAVVCGTGRSGQLGREHRSAARRQAAGMAGLEGTTRRRRKSRRAPRSRARAGPWRRCPSRSARPRRAGPPGKSWSMKRSGKHIGRIRARRRAARMRQAVAA